MSHSMYTHTQNGNKAMILLRVLSDITKFHIQDIFLCHEVAVCVHVLGGGIYSYIRSSVHLHKRHAHS